MQRWGLETAAQQLAANHFKNITETQDAGHDIAVFHNQGLVDTHHIQVQRFFKGVEFLKIFNVRGYVHDIGHFFISAALANAFLGLQRRLGYRIAPCTAALGGGDGGAERPGLPAAV